MAGVGAFWGIKTVVMVLHLAIVIGGIIAIVLLITKRQKSMNILPLGHLLFLGFWVDYFLEIVFYHAYMDKGLCLLDVLIALVVIVLIQVILRPTQFTRLIVIQ